MQLTGTNRYLLLRRVVQAAVLLLFIAGHARGWKLLQGNLSESRVLGVVPLADPYALLQVAFTGTMVASEALLGGVIVLASFALIGGRAFCGWVCPVNMVADLAGFLRRAAGIDGVMPAFPLSRNVRYWVLGLGLVLSSVLGVAAFEWISPVSMLHRGLIYGMGAGWTLIIAVFLFDLVAVRHGFCGHLCPLGGFYALIGRAGMVRVKHFEDRCTRCMECVERCPEPQVLSLVGRRDGFVNSGECTNCGRCIDACRDKAMKYSIGMIGRRSGEHTGGSAMGHRKTLMRALIGAVLITAISAAGASAADGKGRSSEELGIRKETLTDEAKVQPAHGEYGKMEAGKSKPFGRAFENSPPLIPHDLTGMLPIAQTNNACLGCHQPEQALALGATAMPKSHFFDMDTGKDLLGNLDGKRYDCMQCHVPQVNIPETVKNTFKADFRSKKSKTSSNLLETLSEGVKAD
jgi:ferredoxin-type protein NapH